MIIIIEKERWRGSDIWTSAVSRRQDGEVVRRLGEYKLFWIGCKKEFMV